MPINTKRRMFTPSILNLSQFPRRSAGDAAARDLAHLSGQRSDRTRNGWYPEFPL
jgi:hypothetical protein